MIHIKNWLSENKLIVALMIIFAIVASIYSITTPLFEMSDELWHYPMVKTIADGNGLPIQDPANPGPWKQEGSQPPLYYYIGAAATFWIDTSDVDEVLRPNPHVDNGVITPDGNVNLILHNYAREKWPWRGTTLAVHIVRFLSVLMGTGVIYFTYRIGEELFPEKPWLALAGAAAVAFTPMFVFISAAVNNDNLAVLLSALGLWLMIRIVRESEANHPTLRLAVILGVVLGLSALTKASGLGQFGLAGLTMAYAAWKKKRWQTFFIEGPIIVAIAAAIAGWWYYRNWVLYSDLSGLNVFIEILGRRATEASLLQLWGERYGFMQSYWGLFGGVNVPMPGWTYTILNILAVLGMIGTVVYLVLKFQRDRFDLSAWMPTLLTFLWLAAVITPLATYWARITWSSQGRLVFSAIMVINVWFVAGLSGWLPEQWGKPVTGVILGFMAVLTILSPFAWIAPTYRLPAQINIGNSDEVYYFTPPGKDVPALRLAGFTIDTTETEPGGAVELVLYWDALAPMERNWSTFIHLEDEASFIAGQRDTYPGLGLIATSEIEPGRQWVDHYVVQVDEAAYAPTSLNVNVGVYDYYTGERMILTDDSSFATLGTVELQARQSEEGIPNPVSFNFEDELVLSGYRLDRRQGQPEESLTLTLYWRGLRQMQNNYTISAQVLGPENRIYAQQDSWPLDGSFPTTAWIPGELVQDQYQLTLADDTPPGVYDVQIVVYWQDETGSFTKLQRVTEDGRLLDDFILLTKVRVTD
jgi:hypothetical protein